MLERAVASGKVDVRSGVPDLILKPMALGILAPQVFITAVVSRDRHIASKIADRVMAGVRLQLLQTMNNLRQNIVANVLAVVPAGGAFLRRYPAANNGAHHQRGMLPQQGAQELARILRR